MEREKGFVAGIFEDVQRKLTSRPDMSRLPRHFSGGYVEPAFRNLCAEVDLPGERRISPTGRVVYGFDTASAPDETVVQRVYLNDTLVFDHKPIKLSELDFSSMEARAMAWQQEQAEALIKANLNWPTSTTATSAANKAVTGEDIIASLNAIMAKFPRALKWENDVPSFHLSGLVHLNVCKASLILFYICFQESVELTPYRVEVSAPFFDGSEFLEILYRVEAIDRAEYQAIRTLYPRTNPGWMTRADQDKCGTQGWMDRPEEDRRAIWRGILWAMHARRQRRADWLNLPAKYGIRSKNLGVFAPSPCA